jgi:REP element-mobilizing transposase RayT
LELEGGWYHVTGRGNERKEVFRDDEDRERFLLLLGGLEARYGVEIHGYVLINNHYHLLVRLGRDRGLSAAMQWLAVSYTIWFNRRHGRSGHLFQGRYKAILLEFDRWGAELSRYIHLNPVRVRKYGLDKRTRAAERRGLAEAPVEQTIKARLEKMASYPWSSHPQYAGTGTGHKWLHTGEILSRFDGSRSAYREYVEEAIRGGIPPSPWEELAGGFLLGGEEFQKETGKMLKGDAREQPGLTELTETIGLDGIAAAVAREKGEAWEDFVDRRKDWGRDMALLLARRHTAKTNRELAEWGGGMSDSAVAHAIKRFEQKMEDHPQLREIYARLLQQMSIVKI